MKIDMSLTLSKGDFSFSSRDRRLAITMMTLVPLSHTDCHFKQRL